MNFLSNWISVNQESPIQKLNSVNLSRVSSIDEPIFLEQSSLEQNSLSQGLLEQNSLEQSSVRSASPEIRMEITIILKDSIPIKAFKDYEKAKIEYQKLINETTNIHKNVKNVHFIQNGSASFIYGEVNNHTKLLNTFLIKRMELLI